MSDNYARACAVPRRLELGGEVVYVQKFTPRSMGILQAFIIDCLENPYAVARATIAEMTEDDARNHWVQAYSAALESWPPDLNSEIGMRLLGTPEGRGVLAWAAASRHTRGLTRERADAIGLEMSADEFFTLLEWMAPGEVGDLKNPDAKGGGQSYAELRGKLCERYPGWTFDTVDNLTFEQIGHACTGGKPVEIVFSDEAEVPQTVTRWREYYVGL